MAEKYIIYLNKEEARKIIENSTVDEDIKAKTKQIADAFLEPTAKSNDIAIDDYGIKSEEK